MLLAKYPSQRHPQTRIRAVCYLHKFDNRYIDLQHFDGPIAEVIEQLITFVLRNTPIRAYFSSTDSQRQDISEYPEYAVREAIVNAAVRDYGNFAGGIKVEINPYQVKIWNSGEFPKGIDQQSIEHGHLSILRNPDIAHGLYLQGYMEKPGRGSIAIQEACKQAGLPPPKWESAPTTGVTLTLLATEVTTEVEKLISVMTAEHGRDQLMGLIGLNNAEHFRKSYIKPALEMEPPMVEMTIPDKPTSSKQKYRLTLVGQRVKNQMAYKS